MPAKSIVSALFLLSAISVAVCWPGTHRTQRNRSRSMSGWRSSICANSRPDLAIPELKKIVALDPGNVMLARILAFCSSFSGDYGTPFRIYSAAIELQPNLWKVQALLGLAEEHTSGL